MAKPGDVISADELWEVFEHERKLAWKGVEADIGTEEWNVAAGKIDVINHICTAVRRMNTCSRSDGEKAERPILEDLEDMVHIDYADQTSKTEVRRWQSWTCPHCGSIVGERIPMFANHKPHDQRTCNFCSRCGQRLDWKSVMED